MACSTLQSDWSLERHDKWKRYFLKTNVFYFAERQELRSPRRMETLLPEDQQLFCFAERQEPRAPIKMETLLSEDQSMACSTLQNDRSLARPERWKPYCLKTNGMFYFAERQELRAPRKIETLLSEDRWHVRLCRTTGASSA